jgi:PTS system mannose-specific IIB component
MSVVLARVDNRLIHGQVLEAWVPHVRADYILVVNDVVAKDPFRKQLMLSCVPKSLQVKICSLEELPALSQCHLERKHNLLVLFATPQDALSAYENGLKFSRLNLGNMHLEQGKRCISRTLAVDENDTHTLDRFTQLGVEVTAQCVPSDKTQYWNSMCHDLGN